MKIIQLVIFLIALNIVESFLPFSLTQMNFLRAGQETTITTKSTTATEATPSITTSTKTEEVKTTTEATTATAISTETATLETKKSVFEENAWLDNIVQFIFERLLRFIKLLIQKFIMKHHISLADFLLTALIV